MNTQMLFLVRKTMACFGALALAVSMAGCSVGQPDDEDLGTEESGTADSSKGPGVESQGVILEPECPSYGEGFYQCTVDCQDAQASCVAQVCAGLSGTALLQCRKGCDKQEDTCVSNCKQTYCIW